MFNLWGCTSCFAVLLGRNATIKCNALYQARRILTLNEQVNELFTNKIYIKQFKIIAQNLGPRKKYYSRSSATSFRLKVYLLVCYTNGAFKNSNVLLNMTLQYNRKHKISSVVPCVWMYYVYVGKRFSNNMRFGSKQSEGTNRISRKPFNDILTTCFTR